MIVALVKFWLYFLIKKFKRIKRFQYIRILKFMMNENKIKHKVLKICG
jgi:hypothetical protein